MRGDLLSGGIPKRLLVQDGKWALEVVRQVAVERNVYRPHTQRIEGSDVILNYLRRAPQFSALAQGACELLNHPGVDSRSYEVVNGEWVQSMLAPSYIDELKRQHRAAARRSQHVQLLEIRAECVRLRHANTHLSAQLSELQAQVKQLTSTVEELKLRQPVVLQTVSPVEENQAPEPQAPVSASVAEEAAEELPQLRMAKSFDFIRCIEQLIGSGVTAQEVEGSFNADGVDKMYIAQLVDDHERLIGGIIMDLRATVFLGGTLLMVPEEELDTQVRNQAPSEDSMAASSEVCNALAASLNNVPENAQVRTKYLEVFHASEHTWVRRARVQMHLEDSFGGHVYVVCR
jgi:hypothetical protein